MGSEVAIEAAAFGRGGMGIARTADELPRLIDAFQPGLVIVLVGINDVTWQRGVEQRYAREAANGCSEPAAASPSDFQILRRLSLAMNGRGRAGTSLVRGQLEWHSENLPTIRQRFQQIPEVVPTADPALVERFTRDLRRIVSDATRDGAAILLLGQPFLWKDDLPQAEQARLWFAVRTETGLVRASPGWLQREMRELNEAQRQMARKSGARFLDLEPLVPKDLDHFFDDCHFTDRGSAVVAEAVLPVALDLVRARQDRGRPPR
jgi:lysophospholipase L1-like esterase